MMLLSLAVFFADLDHLVPLIKTGVILRPLALLRTTVTENDSYGNERWMLHNVLAWAGVSLLVFFITYPAWGIALSLAYVTHLLLDAIDGGKFLSISPKSEYKPEGANPVRIT